MNRISTILIILSLLFSIPSLAQENLFFVFLNSNPDREEISAEEAADLQKKHLDNIGRLYDEGQLLLAGPFDGGGGIFVLKTPSIRKAQELLASDPAIAANRFIVKTYPMMIQKGWICEQEEPYDMIQMQFVHFEQLQDESASIPFKEQYDYMQSEEVFFAAALQKVTGEIAYIAILAGDAETEKFATGAPVTTKETHTYSVKGWWTTDQTFCPDKFKKIN